MFLFKTLQKVEHASKLLTIIGFEEVTRINMEGHQGSFICARKIGLLIKSLSVTQN